MGFWTLVLTHLGAFGVGTFAGKVLLAKAATDVESAAKAALTIKPKVVTPVTPKPAAAAPAAPVPPVAS